MTAFFVQPAKRAAARLLHAKYPSRAALVVAVLAFGFIIPPAGPWTDPDLFHQHPPVQSQNPEEPHRTGRKTGTTVAHYAGARPVHTGRARKDAPTPNMFRTGWGVHEPTIGVASDGALFLPAFAPSFLDEPTVIRSLDGGLTWEDTTPGPLSSQGKLSFVPDPYLYLDPATDRTFYSLLYPPGAYQCGSVATTDDLGTSWAEMPKCGQSDHQNIFAGPPVSSSPVGYPNVVYYCSMDLGTLNPSSRAATCTKSLDGGRTFIPTGLPAFIDGATEGRGHFGVDRVCGAATGHGIADDTGRIYLPAVLCGVPGLAISDDEGATWTLIRVGDMRAPANSYGALEHEAAVGVDRAGNLYYLWIAHDRLPYLVVSSDRGATWSKPKMVAPPGVNETSLPSLAAAQDGRVAMVYMGTSNSPGPPFDETTDCLSDSVGCIDRGVRSVVGALPDPPEYENVTWNGYITVTDELLSNNPLFYSASINDPLEPFVTGTCGPTRCKGVLDFLDVQFDSSGSPWAAFVDECSMGPCNDFIGEGIVGTMTWAPKRSGGKSR